MAAGHETVQTTQTAIHKCSLVRHLHIVWQSRCKRLDWYAEDLQALTSVKGFSKKNLLNISIAY